MVTITTTINSAEDMFEWIVLELKRMGFNSEDIYFNKEGLLQVNIPEELE